MHDDHTEFLAKMGCFGLTDKDGNGAAEEPCADQFLIADLRRSLTVHRSSMMADDPCQLFGNALGQLLMVTDGIGTTGSGARACSIVLDAVSSYVLNRFHADRFNAHDARPPLEELGGAFDECRERLEVEAETHPEHPEMGASLTMAYVAWPVMYLSHAGDSRCYLLRDGRLQLLTVDHTVARQLLEEGVIDEENARQSRWNKVLSNGVIAGQPENRPDLSRHELRIGDVLLLCSNSLAAPLGRRTVADLLRRDEPAEETCRHLASAAREAGALGSLAVVVARFRSAHAHPREMEAHESSDANGTPVRAPGEMDTHSMQREATEVTGQPAMGNRLGWLPRWITGRMS